MNDNDKAPSTSQSGMTMHRRQWPMRLAVWLVIVVLLAASGILAFMWYQAEQRANEYHSQKLQLEQQVDQLNRKLAAETTTPEGEGETACSEESSNALKANIKAALDTQNTAVFSTYTTNPVLYVLAASEYGGEISPDEAATSLEYTHSATGPWDFNLPAVTVAAYDAGFYTDYFDANTYVGRAASGMVIAFDFVCGDKIKQIFVAADESLLLDS